MAKALAFANSAYREFLRKNPMIQDTSEAYLTFLSGFESGLGMNDEFLQQERELRVHWYLNYRDANIAVRELEDKLRELIVAEHSVEHLYEHEALRYTGVVMVDDLKKIVSPKPESRLT